MCGIAGEARVGGGISQRSLLAMSEAITHRGPDDDGLWTDALGRCGFAFRRLSIIDLSPTGHQPMHDPLTGNVIVFNGEIYNFQALRKECESLGDRFVSRSDTEVILALYRRHGTSCFSKLRGMFALAIWNDKDNALILARDRLGKKPLHYALDESGIVFCSELRGIARHPTVSKTYDTEAVELYLQLHSIPAPWTIYRAVRKLPPGHYAVFSRSGFRLERYWDIDYRPKVLLDASEALAVFEEKFTEAVRLRMISDVPLGALLSGGIDSSLVVAKMSELASAPVKTFSVGFEESGFNELPYANHVAQICGTQHCTQIVTGDLGELLPTVARQYGEPFADPSAIPSFLISRTAREHVTVVLNGDGGDELLGGYPRYARSAASLIAARMFSSFFSASSIDSTTNKLAARSEFAARILGRVARDLARPELGSLTNARDHWNDWQRGDLLKQGTDANLLKSWRRTWLAEAAAHSDNPIDFMLYFDNHTHLPNDLLVKMDIASMHCGLEARSPLLDHNLVEFCAALPVSQKVHRGTGKYLLKKLAIKTFGRAFATRQKQGFGIPLARWLKGPLRETMKGVLSDRNAMEPFNPLVVSRVLDEFLAGRTFRDDSKRLWGLLMFGLWRQGEGT